MAPSSPFQYRDGELYAEDVAVSALATSVGTPFYCYAASAMAERYSSFAAAFADRDALVCYAMKANGNQAVIATFAKLGAGADVVSGGEMARALAAGVPAKRIVFAGVGKTAEEMAAGLDAGIFQFNVESEPELVLLSEVAAARGLEAPISVRVNPDVDAKTHANITTGLSHNKFGVSWRRAHEIYRLAAELPAIAIRGIAVHIGSQLTDLEPMEAAFTRVVALAGELRGAGFAIERIDFGGGLGITYSDETSPSLDDYAPMVKRAVGGLPVKLVFEPGRYLVGNAGILVSRVIYVKQEVRRFAIVDAAMNDLLRPMLYDAWHEIFAVRQPAPGAAEMPIDIVGPICESTDRFAEQRAMPALARDDLIAFASAGAYAAVMSSTYNGRALVPEVLVRGPEHAVVRPRKGIEEIIAAEPLPAWLA